MKYGASSSLILGSVFLVQAIVHTVAFADDAELGLPDFIKNTEQTVVQENKTESAVLNPELNELREYYRDPKQVRVIEEHSQDPQEQADPIPTVKAEDLLKKDNQELPPMPTIGQSLADPNFSDAELKKSQTIVLSKNEELLTLPPGVDRKIVADATITVIDGQFLKENSFGKLSKSVKVKKDHKDPKQFYDFSLNYNNLDPKIIDSLKYSTLDLALEYGDRGSNLKELEKKLNALLADQYGLLFATAKIQDPPRDTGSSLVLINFEGAKINQVTIKNYSDYSMDQIKEEFNSIKSGMYLTSSTVDLPILDFAIKYKIRANAQFHQLNSGMVDVIITVPAKSKHQKERGFYE